MAVATVPDTGETAPALAPAEEPLPEPPERTGPNTLVLGTLLVIGAGFMLYAGLIGSFLAVRARTRVWPPQGVDLDRYLGTVLVMTALMLAACAQWAVVAARRDDQRNTIIACGLSLGLGVAQVNAAWYAMVQADFGAGDHAYGVLFFAIVGTFLALALGGAGASLVALLRAIAGQFSPEHHSVLTAHALWWHFLGVLWVAIFAAVWVLR